MSLNSITSKFYKKNKKPWIKLVTLQKHKTQGGLEAPNFQNHYLIWQINYSISPVGSIQTNEQLVVRNRLSECQDISISDLPFTTIKPHNCFNNIVTLSTSLTAWWKINKIFKSTMKPCKYTPIQHSPDFLLNKRTLIFNTREQSSIRHLFQNKKFITFQHLVQKYDVRTKHNLQ